MQRSDYDVVRYQPQYRDQILELQASKRKLVEAVLGGEEQSMPSLTADDLRLLLS